MLCYQIIYKVYNRVKTHLLNLEQKKIKYCSALMYIVFEKHINIYREGVFKSNMQCTNKHKLTYMCMVGQSACQPNLPKKCLF